MQDKCESVCRSDINNVRNSDSNSVSYGDSDDDETKYYDRVESESDTKYEISYDRIQQMVCSMKISDKYIALLVLMQMNVQ